MAFNYVIGCDYLASLPGIGLGKSKAFWTRVTNPDLRAVLPKIPAYLKMTVAVTEVSTGTIDITWGRSSLHGFYQLCVQENFLYIEEKAKWLLHLKSSMVKAVLCN
jgi:hypothetical protein